MGIDGIGKKPPTPAPQGAGGAEGAKPAGKPFEVSGVAPAEASRATEVAKTGAATPLERLRAGEIDVDKYVDLKVEQATAHLRGLPRVDLDSIRDTLRAQVASDPALAELVTRATGRAPSKSE